MKITIFGLAGSGTSTVGKLLAKDLSYEFKSTGNIMREWAENMGLSLYEFEDKVIKTDSSFDKKLDTKVVNYGEQNDNFIFESRLAWNFIPDSFKIYLKCDEGERYNRIQRREGINPEIVEKNKKRESELVERYKVVYPEINFPPKEDIFDLVLDVSNILPKDIIDIIISELNILK